MSIISETDVIQCAQCGFTFAHIGNLKEHQRIHTKERSFICPEEHCGKAFISKDHLRKHIRSAHSNKIETCKECKKTYKTLTALRKHERSHSDERRFICVECNKGFDISEQFKIHMRKHQNIKPYECGVCHKKFESRAICKRHKRNLHNTLEDRDEETNFENT